MSNEDLYVNFSMVRELSEIASNKDLYVYFPCLEQSQATCLMKISTCKFCS